MAPRILVVDDSISTRALIGRTLETGGYAVLTAGDGVEALEAFANGEFDIVITDQWMPKMTGIELVRAIRDGKWNPDVPILAVTTDAESTVGEDAVHAGASECIVKPFAPSELLDAISRMIELRGEAPDGR
jgi:two-component system, chemotaxis family, chemotaxis protein CheY